MLKISSGQSMPQNVVIPSPSFGLNYMLGGGFWTGRFHILWGNPHCGKSTMLYTVLAQAQQLGYLPVIIDAEKSYTDEWAAKCGMDIGFREVYQSNIIEPILNEIVPIMRKEKCVILVDSINGLESEKFFETEDAHNQIGAGARARRKLFMRMSEEMHPVNNMALMVSQQTIDLSGKYAKLAPKIGKAEEHWATNIIRLSASKASDKVERQDDDMIVNKQIEWTLEKCKQGPVEGVSGKYWFEPQSATIDKKREIINLAIKNNLIEKAGSWYSYNGKKVQGDKKLSEVLEAKDILDLEKKMLSLSTLIVEDEIEER